MNILSLKSILLYQLERVSLDNYEENAVSFIEFLQKQRNDASTASEAGDNLLIDLPRIPLQSKQKTGSILYTSALPQVLASSSLTGAKADPSDISKQLVDRLEQSRSNLTSKITNRQAVEPLQISSAVAELWLEFEIETQKPGWIAFRVTRSGIEKWLDCLQRLEISELERSSQRPPAFDKLSPRPQRYPSNEVSVQMLWQAQYAHACCCRLLRQCRKQAFSAAQSDRIGQTPSSASQSGSLLSTDRAEALLQALVSTADSLFWIPYRWPNQQYQLLLKHSAALCQAFERFYGVRLCEFEWRGAIASNLDNTLSLRQLSLVAATKNVLKVLLEENFGVPAPEQL